MTTRSHRKPVAFSRPFELKGVDRVLPAGDYRVVTDEELIEESSFPVYRRVLLSLAAVLSIECAQKPAPLIEVIRPATARPGNYRQPLNLTNVSNQ
jgi:hypothetical protein